MTAPKREQLANNAFTQLNGGIDGSQTSVTVTNGSVFPSVGNFRVTVGAEIMLCTSRSSNTLTVVRGQEGTSAVGHSNSDNITHNLTVGGLSRWAQDSQGLWGYSGQPPLGVISDGSGGILTASSFTWVNQGTASATDQNGTILLRAPVAGGENARVLKIASPSAPWTLIAAFEMFAFIESIPNFGLVARKSSGGDVGKMVTLSGNGDSTDAFLLSGYNMTSATAFSSNILTRIRTLSMGRYLWLKLEDDNTNIKGYAGFDGVEWFQIYSVGRTAFISGGPDEIGFYLNNQGSSLYEALVRLVHWSTF